MDLNRYRRYRAPARHGEKFFDPPWNEAAALVPENIRRREAYQLEIGGSPLSQLVADARGEICRLAVAYTQSYRNLPARLSPSAPLLLSGHQPELFHPGVWFKNFVLHDLAKRVQGIAINLVVDNDLGGVATIRVPTGSVAHPRLEPVAYNRIVAEIPFEERGLVEPETFRSFGERVGQLMRPIGVTPLAETWWPRVIAASKREQNLGRCIAAARHELESEWGLHTLELPLSLACETRSFRRFVLHLVCELPKFQQIHNNCLLDFRRANRIRSRSHPVPELEQLADDWLEAPLWIWTREDPRRRRLFVRRQGSDLELSDRGVWRCSLPQTASSEGSSLDQLEQISNQGIRIRPRALITTMYARLVLSDLFVHGIGGGKYDQLTDDILRCWFGIDPPAFLVTTATARLPIARPVVTGQELIRIERELRDLTFNPDRYLDGRDEASALIAEKRTWISAEPPPRASGRERHEAIARINQLLQPFVDELRTNLVLKRDRLSELLRNDRLLGSREFAFCLFPEETLRQLLLDIA